MAYLADRCKKCGKLKGASDLYFCSGCGYGKFEDEDFAWEDVNLLVEGEETDYKNQDKKGGV